MPERLPDARWAVTDGWMQERYELERALRAGLERCEAERTGASPSSTGRQP